MDERVACTLFKNQQTTKHAGATTIRTSPVVNGRRPPNVAAKGERPGCIMKSCNVAYIDASSICNINVYTKNA